MTILSIAAVGASVGLSLSTEDVDGHTDSQHLSQREPANVVQVRVQSDRQ